MTEINIMLGMLFRRKPRKYQADLVLNADLALTRWHRRPKYMYCHKNRFTGRLGVITKLQAVTLLKAYINQLEKEINHEAHGKKVRSTEGR